MENKTELALVLASTSAYRRELLKRLRIQFDIAAPDIDESPLPEESAATTAERLAREKAAAVAGSHPKALIIGSDQVAECDGLRLDKPGRQSEAFAQLRWVSGKEAVFHTAIALKNTRTTTMQSAVTTTRVRFRPLGAEEISRYIAAEPAFDCAGSAKSEGLGIALLDAISGDDPTALVGLPLITLCRMLRAEGITVP